MPEYKAAIKDFKKRLNKSVSLSQMIKEMSARA